MSSDPVNEYVKSCAACSAVGDDSFCTGPDGRQTLCKPCFQEYRLHKIRVFMRADQSITAKYSLHATKARVKGFKRNKAGRRDFTCPIVVLLPPIPYRTVVDNSRNATRSAKRKSLAVGVETSSLNSSPPDALAQVDKLFCVFIRGKQESKLPTIDSGDIVASHSATFCREPKSEGVSPLSDAERSSVSHHIFSQQSPPSGQDIYRPKLRDKYSNQRIPNSRAGYNGGRIKLPLSRQLFRRGRQ